MVTTTDANSFRVPASADLKAAGYSKSHAELLAQIFAELKTGGPRSITQLVGAIGPRQTESYRERSQGCARSSARRV